MDNNSYEQESPTQKPHFGMSPNQFAYQKALHIHGNYYSRDDYNNMKSQSPDVFQSLPTQDTDAMGGVNGHQHDSLNSSLELRAMMDNFQSKGELEAVPERSVEYSEMTNKTSHLDSDMFRMRSELENDERRYTQPFLHALKENYDWKSGPYSKTVGHREFLGEENNPRDAGKDPIWSQYQTENQENEKIANRLSRRSDRDNQGATPSKDFQYNRGSEKERNGSASTRNEKSVATDKKNPIQGSHSAEQISPFGGSNGDTRKDKFLNHLHKVQPFNSVDASIEVGERSYQSHNQTENRSSQKPDNNNGQNIEIQELRERNKKLEERILSKEKLLEDMKNFHDTIFADYRKVKDELENLRREKENYISFQIQQTESEEREIELQREIDFLKFNEIKKQKLINELQDQVKLLQKELSQNNGNHQKEGRIDRIDGMKEIIKRLEEENSKLIQEKRRFESQLDYVQQLEISMEEEKSSMYKDLENSRGYIQNLECRNGELSKKIEFLQDFYEKKEKDLKEKQDDSINESKRMYEENLSHIKEDLSQQYKTKINGYKSKLEKLASENENLKLDLEGRPSRRKFKENEARIQDLETQLEEIKNSTWKNPRKRESETPLMPTHIVREIVTELHVTCPEEVLPKVKEITQEIKNKDKFVNIILNLVETCSPKGYFPTRPTMKQAWKWLKNLMEEYMSIKKHEGGAYELGSDKEKLRIVMDFLKVKDKEDIPSRLRQMVVDCEIMARIVMKVKTLLKLSWINSLSELDKRLELEMNPRREEQLRSPKYH